MRKIRLLLCLVLVAVVSACEKDYVDENGGVPLHEANVVLRVSAMEQIAFGGIDGTRAVGDISQVCSRLSFAVYDADGGKVSNINQTADEESYGTVGLSLGEGRYCVVVIAHSGSGNATISSATEVKFKNNIVTDTFFYCDSITVGNKQQEYDIELRRATAMFRLVLADTEIPEGVSKIKFYYTGGSSTFSPLLGYGSVDSRQTVTLDVAPGQKEFDVYTLPHDETGVLKMTITALDTSEQSIVEKVIEQVPITRNRITRYTGTLFATSGPSAETQLRLTADGDWAGTDDGTF